MELIFLSNRFRNFLGIEMVPIDNYRAKTICTSKQLGSSQTAKKKTINCLLKVSSIFSLTTILHDLFVSVLRKPSINDLFTSCGTNFARYFLFVAICDIVVFSVIDRYNFHLHLPLLQNSVPVTWTLAQATKEFELHRITLKEAFG